MVKNSKTVRRGRGSRRGRSSRRGSSSRRGRTYRQRGGGGNPRKSAIDYMKELNLTGERSAKFTQKFRELGSNEDALERIKRDTFFIENLKKDENAEKKVLKVMDDIAEDKAIEFMKEFNLTDTKRYEFMKRFRQLGSNEQAIETIMNDRDFFRSITDVSSRDNRPVSANTPNSSDNDLSSLYQHYRIGENTTPVSANTPYSSHDNYTSSLLQHYGLE
jgi:hypothetical protein